MQVKVAVIPTAGLGTRFLPITKAVPKSMLPIIDRPTIDYIIDEVIDSGIEEIIIVTSHNTDVIEAHFSENKELEDRLLADGKTKLYEIAMATRNRAKVTFVKQEVLNGLAGAIVCAKDAIGGRPFALLLGDEIIYTPQGDKPCIKQLCDCFEKTGKSVVATMKVADSEVNKYGNLGIKTDGEIKTVYAMKEKPCVAEKLSNYAIIGRYVLGTDIWNEIKNLKQKGSEIILTDALESLAVSNKLVASEFDGVRYDVGDKYGYVTATVEYSLKNPDLASNMKEFLKNLVKDI